MSEILEDIKDAKDMAQDSIETLTRLYKHHEQYRYLFSDSIEDLKRARAKMELVILDLCQSTSRHSAGQPGARKIF